MPERTVSVNLVAQVSGYISGMEQAARKTRDLGTEAEKLASKRRAFEELGRPLLAFGAIAAAAVGIAIKRFADFDAAMSNVSAVTQESAENMALLREAALDAGGATVFTATEAANAIEELGKAGLSTADILGGALNGALALAASGQLEVARAAEITATTLKQFGLDGSQAGRVADVLSAGAGKALGSVEDLAQAMKFVGPVAASMGISLEETTGALALFADQGLIGEQAGTSLRGVLSSLTSPSKEAGKAMEALGINLYDLQTKKFLGVENVAGQLSNAFTNLDEKSRDAALGVIFGNQQVTAARVLFQGGAEDIAKYTEAVDEAGYAARVAADRLDNLKGDAEKLGGAFDSLLIRTGGANDALRTLVQTATVAVEWIGSLPEPVLEAGLAMGAIAAALALAAGSAAIGIPRFLAIKNAMSDLGVTGKSAALGVGLAGGAIALAGFVIGTFIDQAVQAANRIDALRDSLDKATGATTEFTEETIKSILEGNGAAQAARDLGVSYDDLRDAALGLPGAYEKVLAAAEKGINGNSLLAGSYDLLKFRLGTTNDELVQGGKEQEFYANEAKKAEEQTQANADALATLQGSASDAGGEISKLADLIRGFGSAQLSVSDATRQVEQSVDDWTAALTENGATLDLAEQAGRDNSESIDAIAKAYLELAASTAEQTGAQAAAIPIIQAGRDAVIAARIAAGESAEAAEAYADALNLIPGNVSTAVELSTDAARRGIEDFLRDYNGTTVAVNVAAARNFAGGGTVSGPGTSKSDSVPTNLSVGEEVIQEPYASRNRRLLKAINAGQVQSFANGGTVYSSAPAPSWPTGMGSTTSSTKVDISAHGVDPGTVVRMIEQRLQGALSI